MPYFGYSFWLTYIVHVHTVHCEYCHLPNNYVSMSSQRNKLSTTFWEYDTRRGHTYKQSKKIIWKAIINSSHLLGLCVCRHYTSGSILNIHFLRFSFSPFLFQFYFVYLSRTSLSKTINVPHFWCASKISHFLLELIKFKQKFLPMN